MSKNKIHIDPSKRGTFTSAANKRNKTVKQFTNMVLSNKDKYSPKMVRKAVFARNASKWNKKREGGDIVSTMGYRDDSPFRNSESLNIYSPEGFIDMSNVGMPIMANGQRLEPYSGLNQVPPSKSGYVKETPLIAKHGGSHYKMPPTYVNALKTFTDPNYSTSGRTGYNALTNTITYNPNSKIENVNNDWWNEHEKFHHLQNLAGGLSTSGIVGKRPNPSVASDMAIKSYYNRRDSDIDNTVDKMIKKDPSLQFIPKDKLIKGSGQGFIGAESLQYANPNTVEGEARAYENYIREGNPSIFQKGGSIVRLSPKELENRIKLRDSLNQPKYYNNRRINPWAFVSPEESDIITGGGINFPSGTGVNALGIIPRDRNSDFKGIGILGVSQQLNPNWNIGTEVSSSFGRDWETGKLQTNIQPSLKARYNIPYTQNKPKRKSAKYLQNGGNDFYSPTDIYNNKKIQEHLRNIQPKSTKEQIEQDRKQREDFHRQKALKEKWLLHGEDKESIRSNIIYDPNFELRKIAFLGDDPFNEQRLADWDYLVEENKRYNIQDRPDWLKKYGGSVSNIPTYYQDSGTPIYRDTTDAPPTVYKYGGNMTSKQNIYKEGGSINNKYFNIEGVNPSKLKQWYSLGKEAPTSINEAFLLAEAVGYPPSQAKIVAAQWALESARGTRVGGNYNYFGIKSHSKAVRDRLEKRGIKTTANVPKKTKEEIGGKTIGIKSSFLNFEDPIAAFLGHKVFLETNSRYKDALTKITPYEFAKGLKDAGYATSSKYVGSLGKIIKPLLNEKEFNEFSGIKSTNVESNVKSKSNIKESIKPKPSNKTGRLDKSHALTYNKIPENQQRIINDLPVEQQFNILEDLGNKEDIKIVDIDNSINNQINQLNLEDVKLAKKNPYIDKLNVSMPIPRQRVQFGQGQLFRKYGGIIKK